MRIHRLIAPALAGLLTGISLHAQVTLGESFATDPLQTWKTHGNPALFVWNATNENIQVTWDSRETNSYFYRPLGNILAKDDNFSLSFDLRLHDIQVGIDPAKPFSFQVALGFINLASATNAGFLRGTGMDSPNVVTFDYFPDSGFGAGVSPGVTSSNSVFAFGYGSYEITNETVHVEMYYLASEQALFTTMTTNGVTSPAVENRLPEGFGDFRLDTISINSYSDAGQDPEYGGSVLANGTIDNLAITLPPPPIRDLTIGFLEGAWTTTLLSRVHFVYFLERTADFGEWQEVASATGTGETIELKDEMSGGALGFYRVRAERP